ncbi:hypothetical protein, partial [Gordonibacter pamelaeae]|uniref:hypothetical protein n=1 Tax=Gordonibacter pamelaeae TaxID=471189 RepID=UPI002FE1B872
KTKNIAAMITQKKKKKTISIKLAELVEKKLGLAIDRSIEPKEKNQHIVRITNITFISISKTLHTFLIFPIETRACFSSSIIFKSSAFINDFRTWHLFDH